MNSADQIRQTIEACGVIGILRVGEEVDLPAVCQALAAGGLPVLEITLNTPGALDAIRAVSEQLAGKVTIGAGTILDADDALAAISSGAKFIVTPTLQLDTIRLCRSREVPIVCGAMTPTEMLQAHRAGADYVKLFPAGSLGLSYIKAVMAPMPFLRIVPTGGVSLENIESFLLAGLPAVAIGSNLADPRLIAARDYRGLTELAQKYAVAARKAIAARKEKHK